MKKFKKLVVTAIVLVMAFCAFPVKAVPRWNESMLRTGLENAINRRWRIIAKQPAAIIYRDKRVACAQLCEIRISLLTKISERAIFLPADVADYVRFGYVPSDSDEAMALEKVAFRLHDRESWKPIIDKLIDAYKSIRSGYGDFE